MTIPASKTLLATLAASLLALSLVGCSPDSGGQAEDTKTETSTESSESDTSEQSEALESYAAAERDQIPAIQDANPGLYSEVTIEAEDPGTIVYTYVYAAPMDAAASAAQFETMVPELQDLCEQNVFPAMESFGIEGAKNAHFVYLNSDGSPIWEKSFASE